jgi:predicted kinase
VTIVIQIAGTSGSGKSTTVRRLMELASCRGSEFQAGRKAPIGYDLTWPGNPTFVVGAYEASTGGCDTIKDVEQVFRIVHSKWAAGYHVLFEGLFGMNHTRGPLLARQVGVTNFHLVRLTTSMEVCKARVNARRAVGGKAPLENWHNTESGNTRAANYAAKMSFLGVKVHRVASEEAPALILGLLRDVR